MSDGIGIAPIRPTLSAAASIARSGPPTRYPAARASPAPVVSTTSTAGRRVHALGKPRTAGAELDHPRGVEVGHGGPLGLGGKREIGAQ